MISRNNANLFLSQLEEKNIYVVFFRSLTFTNVILVEKSCAKVISYLPTSITSKYKKCFKHMVIIWQLNCYEY